MDMFNNFEECTLTDLEQYINLDDSTLVKTAEDDRLVSLVDSPIGSPSSSEPPSPGLSKSEVSSPLFEALDQFNFGGEEMYNNMDFADFPNKVQEIQLEPCTDSLDTWLSKTVKSETEFVALNEENAAILLNNLPSSVEAKPEATRCTAEDEVSSTYYVVQDTSELISDEELLKLSVKSLNRRLANYSKDVQKMLKQKRRTLKNRGYAQNCRSKRVKTQEELEKGNENLVKQLNCLKSKLASYNGLQVQNKTMQAELDRLRSEVVNLRQENMTLKQSNHKRWDDNLLN